MTGDDPLHRADPAPRERIDRLPLHRAREELWEEIMAEHRPDRSTAPGAGVPAWRRWLPPVAVAAAVAVVAGGAFAVLGGGDDADDRATGPSSSAVASSPAASGTTASSSAPASPSAPPSTTAPPPADEMYAMPPRPYLFTARGWKPEVVRDFDVVWRGPGGATVELTFFTYLADEDPFAQGDHPRGQEITVDGTRTRLTSTAPGSPHLLAITAPVIPRDGTALRITTSSLGVPAFRELLGSLRAVDLATYEKVVKPAVG